MRFSLSLDRAVNPGWEEQTQQTFKNLSAETTEKGQITLVSKRPYSVFQLWQEIVGHLPDTLVTEETDRLPALAGVASFIAPSIGGKYLAGPWEAELAKSLTWARRPDGPPCLSVRTTEPSSIPSWPWVSIKPNDRRYSIPIEFMNRDLQTDGDFTILEVSCIVSEASPFGGVFGGKLGLRAQSTQAQLFHPHISGVGVIKLMSFSFRIVKTARSFVRY